MRVDGSLSTDLTEAIGGRQVPPFVVSLNFMIPTNSNVPTPSSSIYLVIQSLATSQQIAFSI